MPFPNDEHKHTQARTPLVTPERHAAEAEWTPAFGSPEVNNALGKLVDVGIELLAQ